MTETAEQVEPLNELDQKIADALKETNEDPAPQLEEVPAVETPEQTAEEPSDRMLSERAQKRINKVTADKWELTRRAEAAEAKLAEMQQAPAVKQSVEPKLEDFDYDEQAHNSALIDYKVDLKAQSLQQQQTDTQKKQAQDDLTKNFTNNSAKFAEGKADFMEVLGNVPTLQPAVLNELMARENGPELAYFLGKHSDIADDIIRMNPVAAGIKIGEISRKLAEPKQIKPSSAPEPIEPVSAGGVVESDIDGEMSVDDWMKKFNP